MRRPSAPAPLERGAEVELTIDTLGAQGDGIAHRGGYVVLVPMALPGERVRARVTSAARKFGRAEVLAVLQAAPERVAPRCRHFSDCGGCQLQHLAPERQLAHKAARLRAALERALGAGAPPVGPALCAAEPWGQRHKVALHLSGSGPRLRGNFHRSRSLDLIAVDECPVSDPEAFGLALDLIGALEDLGLSAWSELQPRGVLRSVVVRRAAGTGEACLLLVVRPGRVEGLAGLCPELHRLGATTVAVNENDGEVARLLGYRTTVVSGPRRIRERIAGVDYLLSPDAFFQTSPWGAAALVDTVRTFLAPGPRDTVIDLYCGGGLFALAMAPQVAGVIGVEDNETAVGDARASVEHGGVGNVAFHTGRVEDQLEQLAQRSPRSPKVVLDPPRAGAGEAVARGIAALRPERIAYVSCDPDALGRDLAAFASAGYRARSVVPVEVFPHTHHVEAVVELLPA